jgi:putative transposase
MADVLTVSRSAYYAWFKRMPTARAKENEELEYRISSIFKAGRGLYGSPRIHAQLKQDGRSASPNRVARIMTKLGLRAKTKRKFKATTDSNHDLPVAPNLLDQNFNVARRDKVWCSDITYIRTAEGWLYLAVVIDLFSRRVIGWAMRDNMKKGLVLEALEMALRGRKPAEGAIHHSDRGSQYCSHAYRHKLLAQGLIASMSRRGNCYDNSVVESFFHTLKTEHVYLQVFQTNAEARHSIFEFIEFFYNRQRLHSTLGYLSPVVYEERAEFSLSAV